MVEGREELLEGLKVYHEKNFEHLEKTLAFYRTRIIRGDDVLRRSMLEVDGGRHIPRSMFQSTAARDSSLFLHMLLQTAILDQLIYLIMEKPYDDDHEFLFPPLKSELQGLSRFFEMYWNWPDTIRDTADIVRKQLNAIDRSIVVNGEESMSNVVTSLLISTSSGYNQHKYLGISFNLGLASLGLSALFLSGQEGLNVWDEDNLFNLLL